MMGDDLKVDHILQCFVNLFLVLYGDFSSGVLHWLIIRICVNHVNSWHVANCIKGVGEGLFEGKNVADCYCGKCWCVVVL